MQRLLPAILLSAGLQSAMAAAPVHAAPQQRQDAIVQAQLLVPADGAPDGRGARQSAKSIAKPAAGGHDDEETRPGAMLFAALALITGIAVRRWGQGQQ